MKTITLFALSFLITTSVVYAEDELQSAQDLALSWLTLTDNCQLGSSWNEASSFFQAAISESDWASALSAARSSFGELKTRKMTASTFSKTLPGAPNGKYIVFQFDTVFDKQALATETLAMIKVSGDVWRVAAYLIQSESDGSLYGSGVSRH